LHYKNKTPHHSILASFCHFISAQQEYSGDPWIRNYIFSDGTIPSRREIMALLPEYDPHKLSVESLRPHYVKTLQCWRQNFLKHQAEIGEVYGEEFVPGILCGDVS